MSRCVIKPQLDSRTGESGYALWFDNGRFVQGTGEKILDYVGYVNRFKEDAERIAEFINGLALKGCYDAAKSC